MVAGMRSTLAAMDIDILEVSGNSLILSSEIVSSDGKFNSQVMLDKLEETLDQAINDGYKGLWASGDMTWEFGPEQDFSKLMEYELGLERLFHRRKELCGICQYHLDSLPQDAMRQGLLTHPALVVNDTLKIVNPYYLKSSWPADVSMRMKLDEMIKTSLMDNSSGDMHLFVDKTPDK